MTDADTPSGTREATPRPTPEARQAAEALLAEIESRLRLDTGGEGAVNAILAFGAAREAAGRAAARAEDLAAMCEDCKHGVPMGAYPYVHLTSDGQGETTPMLCRAWQIRAALGSAPAGAAAAAGVRWLVRELARLLCETGRAADPRFAAMRSVDITEIPQEASTFSAQARALTDEEAEAIVAAYRAARRDGAGA